jgi:GR25 family glycosyltransferase involved in LPS biosynthesis
MDSRETLCMPNQSFTFHVINLQRRLDRRERFFATNEQIDGVEFRVVTAVDAECLDVDKVREMGLLADDTQYRAGHLACALSHRSLHIRCLTENLPILICEDDAVFRHDFATRWRELLTTLPAHWDIVLLGYNFDSTLGLELIPGVEQWHGVFDDRPIAEPEIQRFQQARQPVLLAKLIHAFGTLAYALSPRGAAKILRDCFPLSRDVITVPGLHRSFPSYSLDCLMNRRYAEWNAYAVFPPLAISPNDKASSDTSTREECGAESPDDFRYEDDARMGTEACEIE